MFCAVGFFYAMPHSLKPAGVTQEGHPDHMGWLYSQRDGHCKLNGWHALPKSDEVAGDLLCIWSWNMGTRGRPGGLHGELAISDTSLVLFSPSNRLVFLPACEGPGPCNILSGAVLRITLFRDRLLTLMLTMYGQWAVKTCSECRWRREQVTLMR